MGIADTFVGGEVEGCGFGFSPLAPPALPLRVLRESWPPVHAVCEGGNQPAAGRAQSSQRWLSVLAAVDELRKYRDQDTLLRRSVELLRDSVGIERAAIFLLGAAGERLYGTWGTGPAGETTDERRIAFDAGASHREAFAHASCGTAQWSRFMDVPLFAQTQQGTVVLRQGENVIIPIPGSDRSLGLVACDWALSGRRADIETLLRAAVFTRVLSPLLQLLAAKTTQVEVANDAAEQPHDASPRDVELAARAAHALHANPGEDRRVLARRLGTTADKLGRAFKATLGESVRDYRNRLRLGRFLSLVDPSGGNLLQAALDAGFGSYAQFHRVFRSQFGCSPIEYLRRGH